jgi:hypothetical protein
VDVPGTAPAPAHSVKMSGPELVFWPKVHTMPAGTAETVSVIVPVKPFCAASVSVLAAEAPIGRFSAVGEAVKVKVGCGAIVSVTLVLAVSDPDVPVIDTVDAPLTAVFGTAIVITVALAELAGLNDAVTPLGRPDALNVTVPVNPFCGNTEIDAVPPAPGLTLRLVGAAVSENEGGAVTVSVRVVLAVSDPDVPVTVVVVDPAAAALVEVNESVLPDFVVADPHIAVTPAGTPETASVTIPVKPF